MKIFFRKSVLICTILIYVSIALVSKISLNLEFLDPITYALEGFEYTDLVYSKYKPEQKIDSNIVLVNIAYLSRTEIAQQIEIINRHNPKVIGIDIFFRNKKNSVADSQLVEAFSKVKNLVLVSDLESPNKDGISFDSTSTSHPQFNQFAINGYSDITSSSGYKTIRSVKPEWKLNDSVIYSFPVILAQTFDSSSFYDLDARNNELVDINWRGDYTKFLSIEAHTLLEENIDLAFIENKIVIMGFLGVNKIGEESVEDKFFTPINSHPTGRANPDMYGATIHANTVSMIINRNYITIIPFWLNFTLGFILIYLNVAVFMWIGENHKLYYDLSTKVLILIESGLLFFLLISLLTYFQLKINITLTIIVLILSGDLTELYVGSLYGLIFKWSKKIGINLDKYRSVK